MCKPPHNQNVNQLSTYYVGLRVSIMSKWAVNQKQKKGGGEGFSNKTGHMKYNTGVRTFYPWYNSDRYFDLFKLSWL